MDNRKYNGMMERINRIGTSKERRKKYKHIVEELGARGITLSDISDENFNGKSRGFIDMIKKEKMTMDEVVVLQQYAKAIINQDTKAAEFIRDSVGEKPSTVVDMSVGEKSAIEQMSDEELENLRDLLKVNVELAKREK